jgi:hypothetical protein
MVAVKKRLSGLLVLLLVLAAVSDCAHKTNPSQTTPSREASPVVAPTAIATPTLFWSEDEEKAWHRFIEDGRYRMAQPTDFRFSEQARREIGPQRFEEYTTRPVVHWWGGTGVIVVDTTRTDQNRFGLIVFMEPDNYFEKKRRPCPYKAAWLYKNKDLSRTGLEQASGYWLVIEYDDSGKRTGKDERLFGLKHPNRCG